MNHLITLFKWDMFIHFSAGYHRAERQQETLIYWTYKSSCSFLFEIFSFHILFVSNIKRVWTCVWPFHLFQGPRRLCAACMRDTAGHTWTHLDRGGQPCFDPSTSGADTLKDIADMHNTCIYVQYVSLWETHKRRQACTSMPKNKHTCVVCVSSCAHMKKNKRYVKSCNHTHTSTLRPDTAGLSCHLMSCEPAFLFYVWKETCVLSHCLREKYEQVLQLFKGHFNLPEEP